MEEKEKEIEIKHLIKDVTIVLRGKQLEGWDKLSLEERTLFLKEIFNAIGMPYDEEQINEIEIEEK